MIGSHISQASLELSEICLPLLPKYRDDRCLPPCPATVFLSLECMPAVQCHWPSAGFPHWQSPVIRTSDQWDLGFNPVFHLRGGQTHALDPNVGVHLFICLLGQAWFGDQQLVVSPRNQISWSFCSFFHAFWVSCSC